MKFRYISVLAVGLLATSPARAQLDMATLGTLADIAWGCGYNSQFDQAYAVNLGPWRETFQRQAHAKGASKAQMKMLLLRFESGKDGALDDGYKTGRQFNSESEQKAAVENLTKAYRLCSKGKLT